MTPTEGRPSLQLPTIKLTPLENTLKTLLLDVAQYIREHNAEVGNSDAGPTRTVLRFTGGWVRDKLLGVQSHDIDVGINNMTGYEFGTNLKEYLDKPETLEKYRKNHEEGELQQAIISLHKIEANPEKSKHLETVTTNIFGFDVDLVNLRKESYSEDSRTPQMEFGTPEEDALRRDATINALFYNLNDSKVEDLTGRGLEDMKNEIIRTPMEPYQTFKDDPLRVLRLIRFASRLGYRIETSTEIAMQNGEISSALMHKISRERVGIEVGKMLQGPDPRRALHIIDRLNLYPTIFANHQDAVGVETSTWFLVYDSLHRLLSPDEESDAVERVRALLVRDPLEKYYAWVIAAHAPWSVVPTRDHPDGKKPYLPRMAEVARDSLRADNKTVTLLKQAATHWRDIIDVKTAVVEGQIQGTPAVIRQQVGLHVRSWERDWRLCILLSLLQEIIQGEEFIQVVQTYDRLLTYIIEQGLDSAFELKPLINGDEIKKFLNAKSGRWLSRALELVIQWQLLHPESEDKQQALEELDRRRAELELRNEARKALQHPKITFIPDSSLNTIPFPHELDHLWREISTNYGSDKSATCEALLVAQSILRIGRGDGLTKIDKTAVENLYNWATQDQSRQICALAVSVISFLSRLIPIHATAAAENVVVALASFTSKEDAWTLHEAWSSSTEVLRTFTVESNPSSFWNILESILKNRIKPLFAKAKNPAITASGRKSLHPIPLPRFDLSILDPETKPWKTHNVHITTVFSWIINQYQSKDSTYLETHFPLLIPPILTLIDDDGVSFKRRGCLLLAQLLNPIRESKSDILRRTNLSSVFEDAIRPCFHSLPTITAEDDSIQLLSAAYPALRSLLQTVYRPHISSTHPGTSMSSRDEEMFISTTTKTLRDHLIPSFHHISSTNTTSDSNFASFPHSWLSTLLLDQITATCTDLGIHTTKYLQDIIPLLYSTLSNPFGTANPSFLLSAVSTARAVILNAYPRIWRWRGELLGAICSCWLHILEDQCATENRQSKSISPSRPVEPKTAELERLQKELQGLTYLLRCALENPVHSDSDQGLQDAQDNILKEIQMLVDADDNLKECLTHEVNPEDPGYFGLGRR
ncbi:hypothetical protein BJY01DRAFT_232881 [Aspergillus pseudoustus]|uniref:ATP:tRNA-specific tRNA nucleotidyltransferase n=1 Tax=Aspergillus pseudoustus TaxID=1810923 RepID=A0ABR4KK77_9EURO